MTAKEVLAWVKAASDDELDEITEEIVGRGLAADSDDYEALELELHALEAEELESDLLRDAADRLRRREYRETLHVLAKVLGRDFLDLETLPLDGAS